MDLQHLKSVTTSRSSRDPRALLLLELGDKLRSASDRCRDNPNDQNVHDVRVATRRLRSMLRAFRKEVQPEHYDALRFDLKQIARLLSPAHSASVRLEQATELFSRFQGTDRRDSSQLHALFLTNVKRCHRELATTLDSDLWRQRGARIGDHLHTGDLLLTPAVPAQFYFRSVLNRTLRRANRNVKRQRRSMDGLHRQRIEIKNARYIVEALAPALSLDARRALGAMRSAQNMLGAARDWNQLADWLQATASASPLYGAMINDIDRRRRKCIRRFAKGRKSLRARIKKLSRACRSP